MTTVTLDGAVVNKATVAVVDTVTATVTEAPAPSRTTMLALPADTPVTVRLLPTKATVATLVVLLVAVRFGTGQPVEPLAPMPITVAGIAAAAALMLFSLTGFESATVVANVTEDSTHTVPRATILGTGFTGLIYLAATVATLLLLSSALAAKSSAPFADAISPILGSGVGAVVAVIAAVSAFGTCNALLLLSAEVGRSIAGANDLPPLFRRTNAAGAPTGSLLVGAGAASLLVLASSSEGFVQVYIFIALVSTVASLVLYAVCAAAALKLKAMGKWSIIAIIAIE